MQITKITVSRGVTINTGNFNSVRIDVQMEALLEKVEGVKEALPEMTRQVLAEVERQISDLDVVESIKLAHIAQLQKQR